MVEGPTVVLEEKEEVRLIGVWWPRPHCTDSPEDCNVQEVADSGVQQAL